MSHRAEQVLESVAALVLARVSDSGVKVYMHRRLSLDQDQDELPGISIDYGSLTVDMQDPDEDYYDSTLDLVISCIAATPDEAELRQLLLSMALESQAAINGTPLLGLDFVFDTNFSGWDPPSVDVSGEHLRGVITCNWQVKYRMQFQDAGATGSIPNL